MNDTDIMDIKLDEYVENEGKSKKKKKDFSSLGRKRRMVKRSENDKAINEMISKKKERTIDMTLDEFTRQYGSYIPVDNPTADVYRYYYEIFRTSSMIRTINFTKQLCPKAVEYYYITSLSGVFITTDLLFWASTVPKVFYTLFSKVSFTLDEIYCCSIGPLFVKKTLDNIQEYYVQDYSVDYSSPNWPEKFEYDEQNVVFKNFRDFFYNGSLYTDATIQNSSGNYVCDFFYKIVNGNDYKESDGRANMLSYSKEAFYIKNEKKELVSGVKTLKINKGTYYFQKRFIPTSFCPSTLMGIPKIDLKVLGKVSFHLSDFFDLCLQSKKIIEIDFVTFYNVDYFIDFLKIIKSSANIIQEGDNYDLSIKMYNENIEAFKEFNSFFSSYERCCLYFFDSFTKKINVDRLKDVLTKVKEVIRRCQRIPTELVNKYIACVNGFKANAIQMLNFLQINMSEPLEIIEQCCELCLKPSSESSEIEKVARFSGLIIYNMFKGGKRNIFNAIRSPCSFLENIIGNYSVAEVSAYVDKIKNMLNRKQMSYGDKDKLESDVTRVILLNTIRSFDDTKDLANMSVNELQTYLSDILSGKVTKDSKKVLEKTKKSIVNADGMEDIGSIAGNNFADALAAGSNKALILLTNIFNGFSEHDKRTALLNSNIGLQQQDVDALVKKPTALAELFAYIDQKASAEDGSKLKLAVARAVDNINLTNQNL